jgi:hypothetical protein
MSIELLGYGEHVRIVHPRVVHGVVLCGTNDIRGMGSMRIDSWEMYAGAAWVAIVSGALVLLGVHIRGVRRSLRTSTYQALLQSRNPFHEMAGQYPYIHRVLLEGEDMDGLDDDARVRVTQAWAILMTWYESVLLHRHHGAISEQTAEQWANLLRRQMRTTAFKRLWREYGWTFHPMLRMFVAAESGLPAPREPETRASVTA